MPTPISNGESGSSVRTKINAAFTELAAVQAINYTTNAKLADVSTATIKGRVTAGTGDPEDLTAAQVRALLNVASGATANATDAQLRDRTLHTGTQAISTILAAATARLFGRITGGSGAGEELTGAQATSLLDVFTSVLKGLVPASGGGTANFLRADGTWAAPPGGGGAAADDLLYGGRPLTVGFAGDSIADFMGQRDEISSFYWAATEFYPCEYENIVDTGLGGSSSSHLISSQIAVLEAAPVKPDVMFVQSLQNDGIGSQANADTYFAYLQEYSERALAAGVKLVVLCSRPPKSSTPDTPAAWFYLNRRIERYCRDTPGNYYLDVASAWRQTNSEDTTLVGWRGSVGGLDAFSPDGTHPSAIACREAGKLLAPLLSRLTRRMEPMNNAAFPYDDTTLIGRYGNVLGAEGMMVGTGGQLNGVDNTGVAGRVAGTFERWRITTPAGITCVPSIVTGEDGYRYQQMVLSGTAGADGDITMRRAFFHDVTTGSFIIEAVVETESLSGVRGVVFSAVGQGCSMVGVANIGVGTTRLHLRSAPGAFSNSGFSTINNDISIPVLSGAVVSGTVRVGRVGAYRVS